jgi:hypothetical protein
MKTQILMKIPMTIKNKKRNPTKRSTGNPSIKPTTMMIAKAEVTTISTKSKRKKITAVKNEDPNTKSTTAQRKKKSIMMTVIRNTVTRREILIKKQKEILIKKKKEIPIKKKKKESLL